MEIMEKQSCISHDEIIIVNVECTMDFSFCVYNKI